MEGRGFADTRVSPQHKENEFTGKLALKHVGECLESAFGSNAGLTSTWQPKFAGDSAESVSPARLLYILRCTSFAMQHQIDTIAWDSCAALQAFKNSAALGWGSSTWFQTVRQTCQILPNIYWFYCRSKHGTNLGQRQTSESQTLGRSAVITDLDIGNVSSSRGSKCFASAFHY